MAPTLVWTLAIAVPLFAFLAARKLLWRGPWFPGLASGKRRAGTGIFQPTVLMEVTNQNQLLVCGPLW
jgi:hypothetical protein